MFMPVLAMHRLFRMVRMVARLVQVRMRVLVDLVLMHRFGGDGGKGRQAKCACQHGQGEFLHGEFLMQG